MMDDTTRRALGELKQLIQIREDMERAGLLTPDLILERRDIEDKMRKEIAFCMKEKQKKTEEKKVEQQDMIGKMTYKLRRKLREMDRLREEEDYNKLVDERYEAKLEQERAEAERIRIEREAKMMADNGRKDVEEETKKDSKKENGENTSSTINKKNKKSRRKNKEGANDAVEACQKEMQSLSVS
ncbi:hypothetical protein L3Y34_004024 [Caenorhabditis briggsae]|uniref:Uncharacterized protein n=4 Tax=Caenorhabditis briggsae TaxID=6238 RepID=A0AAE9D4J4_CAEBR|nr:hypothetical protein L3Y34_004024 [Caenorhabditis briggsae]